MARSAKLFVNGMYKALRNVSSTSLHPSINEGIDYRFVRRVSVQCLVPASRRNFFVNEAGGDGIAQRYQDYPVVGGGF